ncbi:MAG: hypothetical protein AB7C89_00140 [Intestinibacillus sp.]
MKSAVRFCCIMLVIGLILSGIGKALGGEAPLRRNLWRNGWHFVYRFTPPFARDDLPVLVPESAAANTVDTVCLAEYDMKKECFI